jgi:hypothetical protein
MAIGAIIALLELLRRIYDKRLATGAIAGGTDLQAIMPRWTERVGRIGTVNHDTFLFKLTKLTIWHHPHRLPGRPIRGRHNPIPG